MLRCQTCIRFAPSRSYVAPAITGFICLSQRTTTITVLLMYLCCTSNPPFLSCVLMFSHFNKYDKHGSCLFFLVTVWTLKPIELKCVLRTHWGFNWSIWFCYFRGRMWLDFVMILNYGMKLLTLRYLSQHVSCNSRAH